MFNSTWHDKRGQDIIRISETSYLNVWINPVLHNIKINLVIEVVQYNYGKPIGISEFLSRAGCGKSRIRANLPN